MKKLLTTSLPFIVLLSSCSLDNTDNIFPEKRQTTELKETKINCSKEFFFLTGFKKKSWIIYRYFINGTDLTSTVEPCNLDNIITIYADGRYIEIEGPSKCDPSFPDIHNYGVWKLKDNNTKFSLVSQTLNTDFDILELKPLSFKARFIDENQNVVEFWLRPIRW